MSQPNRLSKGGRIDRAQPLTFTFNGQSYQGYAGDSLAAALLANGVDIVGRSFKYSRPAASSLPVPKSPTPSCRSAPAPPPRCPTCAPPSRRSTPGWWPAAPTAGRASTPT
ncbi:hypothetical protein PSm6_25400 [Pseudomonas solani]|uniref:Sarcosine oxidase subunit alpha n=1 Tax=Pseudomonas solani TaxID=2731552 RepID=A0ABN6BQ80_9PSED|nr:hypothetical protein PSm6_25400 [Pseudomonas solani]